MVPLTHSFALLASIVALDLSIYSVAAVPLPVSQSAISMDNPNTRIFTANIGYQMIPSSVKKSVRLTIRGSTRASQQAAEAKRSLSMVSQATSEGLQPDKSDSQIEALHFTSSSPGVSSAGWMMNAYPQDGNMGAPSRKNSAYMDGLQYANDVTATTAPNITPTTTMTLQSKAVSTSPCATSADLIRLLVLKDEEEDLSNDEGSTTIQPELFPTVSSLVSFADPTMMAGMQIKIPRPESKRSFYGKGKHLETNHEKSSHKPFQKHVTKVDHHKKDKLHRHFFLKGDGINVGIRHGNIDSSLVSRRDEEDHRRSLASSTSESALIGQLGILKSMSGNLGNAGMSQLVANLVLAPMTTPDGTKLVNQTNGNSEPANKASNVTSPTSSKGNAFLLAPSSSSNGIKLQMVEVQPETPDSGMKNWKQVQFQATLTNAKNEPHLYCAVLQPPSSLQMELCDDADGKRKPSRTFLYESATGEVTPLEAQAEESAEDPAQDPTTSDDNTAIDQAVAMSKSDKRFNINKRRQIGATRLSIESNGPQSVKLVFFVDQNVPYADVTNSESISAAPVIEVPPKASDHNRPPLLDPNQPHSP